MPKDRAVNPATAQLKADKARALKKSKANVAQQRQERLASRNPERLQKQIDELQTLKESQGGKLKPRDQNQLESLERDVKLIRKAREARGDDKRQDRNSDRGPPHKRARTDGDRPPRHERQRQRDSDEDSTDEEARNVPMPRDTPPPIPPRRRNARQQQQSTEAGEEAPAKKKEVVKVFEGAPQIRDLRKEATSAFMPSAVAARLRQKQAMSTSSHGKPEGRLLEPEEVDALEKGGYTDADARAKAKAALQDKDKLDDDEAKLLRELQEQEVSHQLMQSAMQDGAQAAAEAEDEEAFARRAGEEKMNVGAALAQSIKGDAAMAALEAEKEESLGMMATDSQEPRVGEVLAQSLMRDGQKVAAEAAKEEMIGAGTSQAQQPQPVKRRLVEIEDGSDDGW